MGNLPRWWWYALGGVIMASLLFAAKRWSFARLEKSNTAKARGIDNKIPPSLYPRAKVLGEFAQYLTDQGYRVTSGYRSHALTMAIRRGNNPNADDVATTESAHTQARALDVGGRSGATTDQAEFVIIRNQLLADPFLSQYIQRALIEGNHVHIQFRASKMDAKAQGAIV
jgi:hypothetical protein